MVGGDTTIIFLQEEEMVICDGLSIPTSFMQFLLLLLLKKQRHGQHQLGTAPTCCLPCERGAGGGGGGGGGGGKERGRERGGSDKSNHKKIGSGQDRIL